MLETRWMSVFPKMYVLCFIATERNIFLYSAAIITCRCTFLWLWPPCVIRQTIIFLPCGFFFFYLSFFSSLNLSRKNSTKNRYLGTIAQLWHAISLQLRHISTIGEKTVKQQHHLHMFSQYRELRPTSGWDLLASLGTPANLNGFHLLAALLHGTLVVGVSQTLRRLTEGATYIRKGGHHVGHWPTF